MSLVDKIVAENNIESQDGAQGLRACCFGCIQNFGLTKHTPRRIKIHQYQNKIAGAITCFF